MLIETMMMIASCVGVNDRISNEVKLNDLVLAPISKNLILSRVEILQGDLALVREVESPTNTASIIPVSNLLQRVDCLQMQDGSIRNIDISQNIKIGSRGRGLHSAKAHLLFEQGYGSFYLDMNSPENENYEPYSHHAFIKIVK